MQQHILVSLHPSKERSQSKVLNVIGFLLLLCFSRCGLEFFGGCFLFAFCFRVCFVYCCGASVTRKKQVPTVYKMAIHSPSPVFLIFLLAFHDCRSQIGVCCCEPSQAPQEGVLHPQGSPSTPSGYPDVPGNGSSPSSD